jgi:hypothetical protein
MKTTFTIVILFTLLSLNTFAQDSPQWHLPDGAKAHLGKGTIHEIKTSPDGTRIAVAGGIGIWIYDTATVKRSRCYPGIRLGSIALRSARAGALSLVGVGRTPSAYGTPTRANTCAHFQVPVSRSLASPSVPMGRR